MAGNKIHPSAIEEYRKRSYELREKTLAIRDASKELDLLVHKIDLMLNPKELISTEIMARIYTIRACGAKIEDPDFGYSKALNLLSAETDKLVKLTQNCLKAEWERVKRAE